MVDLSRSLLDLDGREKSSVSVSVGFWEAKRKLCFFKIDGGLLVEHW